MRGDREAFPLGDMVESGRSQGYRVPGDDGHLEEGNNTSDVYNATTDNAAIGSEGYDSVGDVTSTGHSYGDTAPSDKQGTSEYSRAYDSNWYSTTGATVLTDSASDLDNSTSFEDSSLNKPYHSSQDRSDGTSGQDPSEPPSYDTGETTTNSNLSSTEAMTTEHAPETRMGISHISEPYSGGTEHGSGTTAGVGHGNKTASDPDVDTSMTRLDSAHKTGPYTGGTEYGSGTTAGPGAGNKMSDSPSNDSTMGKLMEKAGGMLKKPGMVEKGQEKREAAGYGQE